MVEGIDGGTQVRMELKAQPLSDRWGLVVCVDQCSPCPSVAQGDRYRQGDLSSAHSSWASFDPR